MKIYIFIRVQSWMKHKVCHFDLGQLNFALSSDTSILALFRRSSARKRRKENMGLWCHTVVYELNDSYISLFFIRSIFWYLPISLDLNLYFIRSNIIISIYIYIYQYPAVDFNHSSFCADWQRRFFEDTDAASEAAESPGVLIGVEGVTHLRSYEIVFQIDSKLILSLTFTFYKKKGDQWKSNGRLPGTWDIPPDSFWTVSEVWPPVTASAWLESM